MARSGLNNKGGRPKKYSPTKQQPTDISEAQKKILDEILHAPKGKSVAQRDKASLQFPIDLDNFAPDELLDTTDLNEDFVLFGLKQLALEGNVKAYELLGNKLGIFETKEKESIFDIFMDEGTIEDNIENILLVLEDKYDFVGVDDVLNDEYMDNSTEGVDYTTLEDLDNTATHLGLGATEVQSFAKQPEGALLTKPVKKLPVSEDEPSDPQSSVLPAWSLTPDVKIDPFLEDNTPKEDFTALDNALKVSKKISRFNN